MKENLLRCRLCDWSTLRWRTNKKGEKINGYHLLQEHFFVSHPKEYEQIRNKLEREINGTPKN